MGTKKIPFGGKGNEKKRNENTDKKNKTETKRKEKKIEKWRVDGFQIK